MIKQIERGEIVIVDFGTQVGSQQSGVRPAICIQNQKGNDYSGTIIVCVVTTKKIGREIKMPTHILIEKGEANLREESMATTEQLFTIDKSQIIRKLGKLRSVKMDEVNKALKISLGLD